MIIWSKRREEKKINKTFGEKREREREYYLTIIYNS